MLFHGVSDVNSGGMIRNLPVKIEEKHDQMEPKLDE
jgi:hypothetical protein